MSGGDNRAPRRGAHLTAAAFCVGLLIVHAALGWLSVRQQSSTVDEPTHALSAWTIATQNDYRLDCEQPPLFKRFAALGATSAVCSMDRSDPRWANLWKQPDWSGSADWWVKVLYQTPGNDGEALVRRMRLNMIGLSVALGSLIAWAAGRLAGPAAAMIAVTGYALDPTVLAHGPLLKNDLPLAAVMALVCVAAGGVLTRATVGNVVLLAFGCGAATLTKFSGLFCYPLVGLVLAARTLADGDWTIGARTLTTRTHRAAAAAVLCAILLVSGWLMIWLCYGLRYAACADRAIEGFHLLPEACVRGVNYQRVIDSSRHYYFLGRSIVERHPLYFPAAFAFKTPLSTLIATTLAAIILTRRRVVRSLGWHGGAWLGVSGAFALLTLLAAPQQGVRLLLPAYPCLFIFIGLALSRWVRTSRPMGAVVVSLLGVGLIIETAAAFPRYLPFFNVLARPYAARLLGDSNLDWGQDLPALRAWQEAHPSEPLLLCYFGSVDPRAYGLRYTPLPGGFPYRDTFGTVDRPGMIAISITNWQGIYSPQYATIYEALQRRVPDEVVGGSIYLYRSRGGP